MAKRKKSYDVDWTSEGVERELRKREKQGALDLLGLQSGIKKFNLKSYEVRDPKTGRKRISTFIVGDEPKVPIQGMRIPPYANDIKRFTVARLINASEQSALVDFMRYGKKVPLADAWDWGIQFYDENYFPANRVVAEKHPDNPHEKEFPEGASLGLFASYVGNPNDPNKSPRVLFSFRKGDEAYRARQVDKKKNRDSFVDSEVVLKGKPVDEFVFSEAEPKAPAKVFVEGVPDLKDPRVASQIYERRIRAQEEANRIRNESRLIRVDDIPLLLRPLRPEEIIPGSRESGYVNPEKAPAMDLAVSIPYEHRCELALRHAEKTARFAAEKERGFLEKVEQNLTPTQIDAMVNIHHDAELQRVIPESCRLFLVSRESIEVDTPLQYDDQAAREKAWKRATLEIHEGRPEFEGKHLFETFTDASLREHVASFTVKEMEMAWDNALNDLEKQAIVDTAEKMLRRDPKDDSIAYLAEGDPEIARVRLNQVGVIFRALLNEEFTHRTVRAGDPKWKATFASRLWEKAIRTAASKPLRIETQDDIQSKSSVGVPLALAAGGLLLWLFAKNAPQEVPA